MQEKPVRHTGKVGIARATTTVSSRTTATNKTFVHPYGKILRLLGFLLALFDGKNEVVLLSTLRRTTP